jgi:hypothetical protein
MSRVYIPCKTLNPDVTIGCSSQPGRVFYVMWLLTVDMMFLETSSKALSSCIWAARQIVRDTKYQQLLVASKHHEALKMMSEALTKKSTP